MDIKMVEANCKALAEHLAKESPAPLSAIVVLLDRETGNVVARAARMEPGLYREVLRSLLDMAPAEEVRT